MTTDVPPEKGIETSAYDKAIEIVAEIPGWDKRPQIRNAVQQLMMIDSMESVAKELDDGDLSEKEETEEYREQCGVFHWERDQKQETLLRLLENVKKRAPHETLRQKTHHEEALEIVARLPAGWEKLTPLYNAFYRLMMMDANEPLAEASEDENNRNSSDASYRYRKQFDIWPEERHTEQESLLRIVANLARDFELSVRQYGKKLPGDDQSDGNGDSGFDSPRFGPSLN